MKTDDLKSGAESGTLDHDYLNRNYIQLGCRDVLIDVIGIFLDSSPQKLDSIKTALEASDSAELIKLSHGLKGETGSVGAKKLNSVAAAMEQAARRGELDEARGLLPELEQELEKATEALKKDYPA